jgi:hypothetical protein
LLLTTANVGVLTESTTRYGSRRKAGTTGS